MILLPSTATLLLAVKVAVPVYLVYLLGHAIYNRYFHRLRHFPGPFWASITPLWYWQVVRYGKADQVHYPLHEKYGDIVRITPDLLAVCNAQAIDTIYGPKNGKAWRKGVSIVRIKTIGMHANNSRNSMTASIRTLQMPGRMVSASEMMPKTPSVDA